MHFSSLVLSLSILTGTLFAEDSFEALNPPMSEREKVLAQKANLCQNPAEAEEKFDKTFRYGCFCGENYPDIKDPSLKPPEYLTYTQRKKLIEKYYTIRPYDTIDAVCRKHDICYIYNAGEEQACDDAFYKELRKIYDAYDKTKEGAKPGTKAWRCKILASDMSAIFKTIFTAKEDISTSRFAIFSLMTPFTIANKIVQKSALSMSDRSGYPLPFEKCDIEIKNAK